MSRIEAKQSGQAMLSSVRMGCDSAGPQPDHKFANNARHWWVTPFVNSANKDGNCVDGRAASGLRQRKCLASLLCLKLLQRAPCLASMVARQIRCHTTWCQRHLHEMVQRRLTPRPAAAAEPQPEPLNNPPKHLLDVKRASSTELTLRCQAPCTLRWGGSKTTRARYPVRMLCPHPLLKSH